jgi:hypothetical protein
VSFFLGLNAWPLGLRLLKSQLKNIGHLAGSFLLNFLFWIILGIFKLAAGLQV